MSVENVKVGNLSTFAHGTQIKFVDVDGVEHSGEGFQCAVAVRFD